MKPYNFIATLMLVIFSCAAFSQGSPKAIEPSAYFDFWIGEWDLSWTDADGSKGTGKNVVHRILSDYVIQENFSASGGQANGFIGKSWSVYDRTTGMWKQTWVDNSGGYLDFAGALDGEKRIFKRNGINPQGKEVMQRMVFYNIKENSLTWDWEVSSDDGKTWELRWRIYYTRVR
jgi:hypothetical protein